MGFNPNQYGGGDYEPMEPGRYLVRMSDVSVEPSKDGSQMVWRMTFVVVRGPNTKRKVFATLSLAKYEQTLDAKRKKGMYKMGWKFSELFRAVNLQVEDGEEVNIENNAWVRDAFIGSYCAAMVIINGKWNNIDQFLPLMDAEVPVIQQIEQERLNREEMDGITVSDETEVAEEFADDDIPF